MDYSFPPEYDREVYLQLHKDLRDADFNQHDLYMHFDEHGKIEGRQSNQIQSRIDFIDLIPKNASKLEIGPFFRPVIRGDNVKYFDVLDRDSLVERAKALHYETEGIPEINFVDTNGDLSIISEQFDIAVSSHCIEHQPDLADHLQKVGKLLKPGGCYFIIIPDKRYIFDHFISETTIADIVFKHDQQVKTHSLKSVIEHLALTTHNDPPRHWAGDHGTLYDGSIEERVKHAMEVYKKANGAYIDVHASYFTPDSFSRIMELLHKLAMIELKVIRNYHTRRNQNEFFVIMQK